MSKLRMVGLILFLVNCSTWAIEVNTSVASVRHEGPVEVIGSFSLIFDADEVASASPSNPIYIRFSLSQSNGWAATRVDLRPGSLSAVPINLALSPGQDTFLNPDIPDDAVQLVRLVEDESYAWIKFTYSSSLWVFNGNTPASPSRDHRVSLLLGVGADQSVREGGHTGSGGNEFADDQTRADTRMFANYENTSSFGNGDVDVLNFVAFDSQTRGVEDGSPVAGLNLGLGFSNDFVVARAFNYYPCYEFHTKKDDYDSEAVDIPLGRVDMIQRNAYRTAVPSLFLSNSSDFRWEPGSSFWLVVPGFQPDYLIEGTTPPNSYRPQVPTTHLEADSEVVVSSDHATWQVEYIHHTNGFMGLRLNLLDGFLGINESLEVRGLMLATTVEGSSPIVDPLKLTAWGYYNAQGVTEPGQLGRAGSLSKTVGNLVVGSDGVQTVLPYSPYDRTDLQYSIVLTNPTPFNVKYSAHIYHAAGLLQEVIGGRSLAPYSQQAIFFDALSQRRSRMAWTSIYSSHPLAVAGVLIRYDGAALDIFGPSDGLATQLTGPHVTADPLWETTAYVVSGDPAVDPLVSYNLDGSETSQRLAGFAIPSSTGRLGDSVFGATGARANWFKVDSTEQTIAGLVLFNTRSPGMLSSVPLASQPQLTWEYPHLGNFANGWWNGLVVVNPHDEPVQFELTAFDLSNAPIAQVQLNLGPGERMVTRVEFLLGINSAERLVLSGSNTTHSFLMMGRVEGDRLASIPGNLPSSSNFSLPYLPDLESYWTGLALVNNEPLANVVMVTPVTSDAEQGRPFSLHVSPNSKRLINLGDLIDSAKGYSHIMIRALQPIQGYAITGDKANTQLSILPLLPIPQYETANPTP